MICHGLKADVSQESRHGCTECADTVARAMVALSLSVILVLLCSLPTVTPPAPHERPNQSVVPETDVSIKPTRTMFTFAGKSSTGKWEIAPSCTRCGAHCRYCDTWELMGTSANHIWMLWTGLRRER